MAISVDLRQRVVAFIREQGATQAEAAERFQVSVSSIKRWLGRPCLTPDKPGPRDAITLDRERLRALVEAHPDAYLDEYADWLGAKRSTVAYNLQVMQISRKKNRSLPRAE
jgi:transposase